MATRDVWTPRGLVTMPIEAAEAYEQALGLAAETAGRRHARAMKAGLGRACAALCLLFGTLQALLTALDALSGVGVVQTALGLAWALAGLVCGSTTWRAAGAAYPKKEA